MNRIAIIDDHVFLGQVLANDLAKHGLDVVVVSFDGDLVEGALSADPDLVLLDLELGPDMPNGVDLIKPLSRGGAHVVVLSGVENPLLLARCLELGALGLLPKNTAFDQLVEQILSCLETGEVAPAANRRLELYEALSAHRRNSDEALKPFESLSDREQEILADLMAGRSVVEISETAFVAVSTVRSQVKSVLRKLGVTSQLQAVALAYQAGWPYAVEGRERRRTAS